MNARYSAWRPWDASDSWRETQRLGAGKGGIPVFTFPSPDDPDVLTCLNCALPDGACYADEQCPHHWRKRRGRWARAREAST